jgi:hypothetical protein
LFRANPRRIGYGEEMTEEAETQIGRALRELGIELIHAHSRQAKGRVEHCFGSLQDRLVKALRKAGVPSLKEVNHYLDQVFLPLWIQRFRREPAKPVDAHRPLGKTLEAGAAGSDGEGRATAGWNCLGASGGRGPFRLRGVNGVPGRCHCQPSSLFGGIITAAARVLG